MKIDKWFHMYSRKDDVVFEEVPSFGRWIPCSERLPEVGETILFTVKGNYVSDGCLRADGWWVQYRFSGIQLCDDVTAWMPLPKPYKEDE